MDFEKTIGTLNDEQIQKYSEGGFLIKTNFNKANIKQACYELTASNIYYDLSNNNERIDINEKGYKYILIKPKQSVVILTLEELNIPENCIGRILTKGKLFSIGLSAINTYADPGFRGRLGIIFNNNSNNYLKLKPSDSIAKIEFSVLACRVKQAYSGQHGYETNIWPLPVEYTLNEDEINNDRRIKKDYEEIERMYGKNFTSVITRILSVEKYLIISSIIYSSLMIVICSLLIFLGKQEILQFILTIFVGLMSTGICTIIIYKIDKSRK